MKSKRLSGSNLELSPRWRSFMVQQLPGPDSTLTNFGEAEPVLFIKYPLSFPTPYQRCLKLDRESLHGNRARFVDHFGECVRI